MKPQRWLREHPHVVALGALIVFTSVLNAILGSQPWFPDALSEGLHLRYSQMAWESLHRLFDPELPWDVRWGELTYQGFPYGPVTYVGSALLELVLGREPWVRLLYVNLWGSLALVFTYLVGRDLWDRRAGLMAAVCLACYPMFGYYGRRYATVLGTIATSMAVLWLLPKTRGLRRTGPVIGLAVAYAVGLLIKVTILHFTFFGVLAWLAMELRSMRAEVAQGDHTWATVRPWPKVLGHIGLALAILVPTVWFGYYHHFVDPKVQEQIAMFRLGATRAWGLRPIITFPFHPEWSDWQWGLFYVDVLARYQLTFPLTLLCGGALVWLCRKPARTADAPRGTGYWTVRGENWAGPWLAWMFGAGLTLWSLMVVKKWYYTLPLLPLAALASAGLLTRLPDGLWDGLLERAPARLRGLSVRARGELLLGGLLVATFAHSPLGVWRPSAVVGGLFNDPPLMIYTRGPSDPRGEEVASLLASQANPEGGDVGMMTGTVAIKRHPIPGSQAVYALSHQLDYLIHRDDIPIWIDHSESLPMIREHFVTSRWAIFAGPNHADGRPRGWLEGPELPYWGGEIPGGTQANMADVLTMRDELRLVERFPIGHWSISLYEILHLTERELVDGGTGFRDPAEDSESPPPPEPIADPFVAAGSAPLLTLSGYPVERLARLVQQHEGRIRTGQPALVAVPAAQVADFLHDLQRESGLSTAPEPPAGDLLLRVLLVN